jgi:hypothetical protein
LCFQEGFLVTRTVLLKTFPPPSVDLLPRRSVEFDEWGQVRLPGSFLDRVNAEFADGRSRPAVVFLKPLVGFLGCPTTP